MMMVVDKVRIELPQCRRDHPDPLLPLCKGLEGRSGTNCIISWMGIL